MSTLNSFLCFQIECFCSKMVTMVTTKISQSYFRCVKLFIHKILSSYLRDCLLLICAFIISDVTQSIVLQSVQIL